MEPARFATGQCTSGNATSRKCLANMMDIGSRYKAVLAAQITWIALPPGAPAPVLSTGNAG